MVMLPDLFPVVVGANVTVTGLEAPALMLNGKVAPLTENDVPLTAAEVTFKVAVPGFEMVKVRFAEVLTVMLPKLIDAGETPI
jgi:hypothetical protein